MRRTQPNRLRDQGQWHAGIHVDDMIKGVVYAHCPLHGDYTDTTTPTACPVCDKGRK